MYDTTKGASQERVAQALRQYLDDIAQATQESLNWLELLIEEGIEVPGFFTWHARLNPATQWVFVPYSHQGCAITRRSDERPIAIHIAASQDVEAVALKVREHDAKLALDFRHIAKLPEEFQAQRTQPADSQLSL